MILISFSTILLTFFEKKTTLFFNFELFFQFSNNERTFWSSLSGQIKNSKSPKNSAFSKNKEYF
jgi:hypothetical protein